MESKRKNVYITIFVITTILASCVAVFFYLKSTNNKVVTSTEKEENISNVDEEKKAVSESKEELKEKEVYKYVRPEIDSGKCLNAQEGCTYSESKAERFGPISCALLNNKTVNIQSNSYKDVLDTYSHLNLTLPTNVKENDRLYFDISNFSVEVQNIYILGMGHEAGRETLIFLMKDGTIEYMPIVDALKKNSFKSYGKLNNLDNIIDIRSGNISYTPGGGAVTVFAIKSDGSFYDLGTILMDTGYYNF